MEKKLGKILIHSPGPWLASGYGKNSKYIAKYLDEYFDIVFLSNQINTDLANPVYIKDGDHVYKVYGSMQQFGVLHLPAVYRIEKPDALLTIWDVWIYIDWNNRDMKYIDKKNIPNWVPYTPIDAPLNKESLITKALEEADKIIAFSEFGYNEIKKVLPSKDVTIIPHGVDTKIHKPRDKEEAIKKLSKVIPMLFSKYDQNKVTFLFVGEGTSARKDEAGLIKAWRVLLDKHPELKDKVQLIMKMSQPHMMGANYDIVGLSKKYGVEDSVFIIGGKLTEEEMSYLYDLTDFYVTASMGEGWGLPITEAMAHGKPVIVPNNSAQREHVINSGAGWLVNIVPKSEREQLWTETLQEYPLTDYEDLADKMYDAYRVFTEDQNKYKELSEKAIKYIEPLDWDIIGQKFVEYFKKYIEEKKN